jgi:hypothetical protein
MRWFRFLGFALLVAVTTPASAQRGSVPLYDFKDIAVAAPTTPSRVKAALVRTALGMRWDIVENADGSLLAWVMKDGNALVKLRITYDAAKYSVAYVDSTDFKFVTADAIDRFARDTAEDRLPRYLEKNKDSPDSPFAVRTPFYIQPGYEDIVRELLITVRRHLDAPEV